MNSTSFPSRSLTKAVSRCSAPSFSNTVAGDVHLAHLAGRGCDLGVVAGARRRVVESRDEAPVGVGLKVTRAHVARRWLVTAPIELMLVVVRRRTRDSASSSACQS